MKLIFLGDIVGRKGREAVRDLLAGIKERYHPDFIIANGENSAHGKGITKRIYDQLIDYGIDCITLGNHAFSKKEIIEYLPETKRLVCPLNHISGLGEGYRLFKVKEKTLCIVNILGTYMQEEYIADPYEAMDKVLEKTGKERVDLYIVDFHAEATAEKRVFMEYYRNRVNAVIGTHTHIQTADEQIIEGTAFITDVGMCGPFESVIGRDIEECIDRMVRKQETRYTISLSEPILCGLYMEFSEEDNRCIDIERIQIRP